jgi:Tol biopolymer transport system component
MKTRTGPCLPLGVVGVLLTTILAVAGPAAAKTPGSNGRIAFDTGDGVTWIVNADGSGATELQDGVPSFVPRWSPNGTRLLLGTFTDVGLRPATVNPDGTHLSVLPVPDLPAFMDIGPCVWVPPGTQILCKAQNFATADHSLDGIYRMDVDGTHLVRLTVNPFPPADPFGGGDAVGDVSPDGHRFIFMRARPDPGHPPGREQSGALFVENLDGTGLHQITQYGVPNSHDDGFESWSPDGSKILFGSENGNLYTIRPDGNGRSSVPIRAAAGATFAAAPAWSPDGSRIVTRLFLGSTGRTDIYTLRSDGSDLTRVSPDGIGSGDHPDWGPS